MDAELKGDEAVTPHAGPADGDFGSEDGRGQSRRGPFRGVVALDGPSGTGKSTVARRLARRLGTRYLDTGAMYRAATLAVLDAGAELSSPAAVSAAVAGADIDVGTDPAAVEVRLGGRDVSESIRSAEVTAVVSAVSAVPAVRAQLVDQQRGLIGAGGIVVEGRDIATVVWPRASVKVYLTASPAARARRRAGELGSDVELVAADLQRRDRLDSTRQAGPLAKAEDAVELDTTALDIDEVVSRLVEMVRSGQSAAADA